jgi:hypothetical protein
VGYVAVFGVDPADRQGSVVAVRAYDLAYIAEFRCSFVERTFEFLHEPVTTKQCDPAGPFRLLAVAPSGEKLLYYWITVAFCAGC